MENHCRSVLRHLIPATSHQKNYIQYIQNSAQNLRGLSRLIISSCKFHLIYTFQLLSLPLKPSARPWLGVGLLLFCPFALACLLSSSLIASHETQGVLRLLPPGSLGSIIRYGFHGSLWLSVFYSPYRAVAQAQLSYTSQTHKQEFCSKTSLWLASKVLSIYPTSIPLKDRAPVVSSSRTFSEAPSLPLWYLPSTTWQIFEATLSSHSMKEGAEAANKTIADCKEWQMLISNSMYSIN